jgi:hypothetical protein
VLVFLPALGLTVLLRARVRRGPVWAASVGLGIAAFFVLLTGFHVGFGALSRPGTCDYDFCYPSTRAIVGFIVGGSLVFWLAGVGAGVVISAGVIAGRRARSVDV